MIRRRTMIAAAALVVFATAIAAQEPAKGTASDLPTVLPELVLKADIILQCVIGELKPTEGGTILSRKRGRVIRGQEGPLTLGPTDMSGWEIFLPEGNKLAFAPDEACLLFLRADPEKRRLTPLEHPKAKLPADAETGAAVRAAYEKHPRVTIAMTTDKPAYKCGDKVTMVWRLTNNMDAPLRIYTGPFAFQMDHIVDGRAYGSGSGGSHERRAEDYVMLAPQQVHEKRYTIPSLLPEGSVGIRMRYQCIDNWVGQHDGKVTARMDNVFLGDAKTSFSVEIGPPDEALVATLKKALESGIWLDQLDAMAVLARGKSTCALPEVRAMAGHPWKEIRLLAIQALTMSNQPMSEQLKGLAYDPSPLVRNEAVSFCQRRNVPDASLAILAQALVLREAAAKGYMPVQEGRDSAGFALYRLRDPRLGDVLSDSFDAFPGAAYLVAMVAMPEAFRRRKIEDQLTDEEKAQVREAWQAVRENVQNRWTKAELDKEVALCRAKAFRDFKYHEKHVEIRELMKRLHNGGAPQDRAQARDALVALGPDIVPTTLFVLDNYYEHESDELYEIYLKWNEKEAIPRLLEDSHRLQYGISITAAVVATQLDREATYPQIVRLSAKSRGAIIARGMLGERSMVPLIMEEFASRGPETTGQEIAALVKCTGKQFALPQEWKKWWEVEGAKQEWK